MFSPKIYGCGVARRCHGKLGGIAEKLRRQFPLMPPLSSSRCQMPRPRVYCLRELANGA